MYCFQKRDKIIMVRIPDHTSEFKFGRKKYSENRKFDGNWSQIKIASGKLERFAGISNDMVYVNVPVESVGKVNSHVDVCRI